jgi:tetratricopeptide (TPR) repeat protein
MSVCAKSPFLADVLPGTSIAGRITPMRQHLTLALSIFLATMCLPAEAQGPNGDVEAARQHFRQGLKYYDLGRFLDAAHEYEAAFVAKDDAAMLFNIGQAYRFAGEYAKALGAYKAYLRRDPKNKRRVEIEARIADLQRLVAAQRETEKAPPGGIADEERADKSEPKAEEPRPARLSEAPPPSPRREPIPETRANRARRFAGIGLIAGGGALAIAGATLTGLAYSLQSAQSHPGPNVSFDPGAPARLRGEQASGGVLLGVGAGAIVGGAVLYVLAARQQHRERLVVAPLVGPGAVGVGVAGALR